MGGVNMRQSRHLLSLILVSILSVSLLVLVYVRTFIPLVILPKFDISSIMIVSLLALVINYYLSEEDSHLSVIAFAFVAFGVLPFVSGFVTILDALLLALKGGITFTAVMFVFNSIQNRLSTNKKNKVAPIISAIMLFLAVQCLLGII